jgi:hypothetical protein
MGKIEERYMSITAAATSFTHTHFLLMKRPVKAGLPLFSVEERQPDATPPAPIAGRPTGIVPKIPESIAATGLSASLIEQLVLKLLLFHSGISGCELAAAAGLSCNLIDSLLDSLLQAQLVQVWSSFGIGKASATFSLTETGRLHAGDHLKINQYVGPAPVPLDQYNRIVQSQRRRAGWLTPKILADACAGMVMTPETLAQAGPAVSAGKSLLIYGMPGNGKTCLAEALAELDPSPIFLPYAIECQGMIIQVFDPKYHQVREPASFGEFDARWFKCRRPFVVSGGELSPEMLELGYNETSKVYDAPLQLKASNGIYFIDDFGLQRTPPAEVLNRLMVPMERGFDHFTFQTGQRMAAPVDALLLLSTNLRPESLGDEAFLRRIQYKMLIRNPKREEFLEIFLSFCKSLEISADQGLAARFIERHYWRTGRPFRRCHPRDVISHAIDMIQFEGLSYELTDELLDRAFESCFVSDEEKEL